EHEVLAPVNIFLRPKSGVHPWISPVDLKFPGVKSISLTEAEEEAVAREVHATHARIELLERNTADLYRAITMRLPGPESIKNQESKKVQRRLSESKGTQVRLKMSWDKIVTVKLKTTEESMTVSKEKKDTKSATSGSAQPHSKDVHKASEEHTGFDASDSTTTSSSRNCDGRSHWTQYQSLVASSEGTGSSQGFLLRKKVKMNRKNYYETEVEILMRIVISIQQDIVQEPVVSTEHTPSSMENDLDTLCTSTSQTTQEEQSHVIPISVEEDDHDGIHKSPTIKEKPLPLFYEALLSSCCTQK
ncbi:hypothetical protein Tco_0585463, partial [Tanacetum coccineum]